MNSLSDDEATSLLAARRRGLPERAPISINAPARPRTRDKVAAAYDILRSPVVDRSVWLFTIIIFKTVI